MVRNGFGPCLSSIQIRGRVSILKMIGDIGSPYTIDESAMRLHTVL